MKRPRWIGLALLLYLVALGWADGAPLEPARDILGLRLSMKQEQVHARLQEIGSLVRKEGNNQEVWKVREDPSYSNILIGFAKDDKVRYITALAREDKEAKKVPYDAVGDLKKAKSAGDPKINVYNYQWTLPAEKEEPATVIFAIGREPDHLSTFSLKRLDADAQAKDNE